MPSSQRQVTGHDGLTVVTRSKEPFEREVPFGSTYINHVSDFKWKSEEFVKQTLLAMDKVSTPYFTLVDMDDPMPVGMCAPHPGTGILFGTTITKGPYNHSKQTGTNWSPERQLNEYMAFHKPMVCTASYHLIRPHLPELWLAELTVMYFMGSVFGVSHDPDYIATWEIRRDGLHTRMGGYSKTLEWLHHHGKEQTRLIKEKLGLS